MHLSKKQVESKTLPMMDSTAAESSPPPNSQLPPRMPDAEEVWPASYMY